MPFARFSHRLITGTIFHIEKRTAKSGRPYAITSMRLKDGDGSQFVRVTAFSDTAQAELLRLADGDALSVQGPLTASIYTAADGNARVYLSIVASNVLALRQPPKERKPKAAASDTQTRQERLAGVWTSERDGPNDPIDFGDDA